MEKIKQILASKKFWTLVAAIVAALSAYFAASCSAAYRVTRTGVHCDTVTLDLKCRSNNFSDFNF